jgi:hypothetical protein
VAIVLADAAPPDDRPDPAGVAAGTAGMAVGTEEVGAKEVGAHGRLAALLEASPPEGLTLGEVLDGLHERAFGIFLLLLALPCCIPFLYGVPQAVALPLLVVAGQMVLGYRSPWLPDRFRGRRVSRAQLERIVTASRPWLRSVEVVLRPRLSALSRPPLDRLVGLALVLFGASILVPLPLTNTVPGIAVAVVALGLIERDGLPILGGVVLGVVWIGLLVVGGAELIRAIASMVL